MGKEQRMQKRRRFKWSSTLEARLVAVGHWRRHADFRVTKSWWSVIFLATVQFLDAEGLKVSACERYETIRESTGRSWSRRNA